MRASWTCPSCRRKGITSDVCRPCHQKRPDDIGSCDSCLRVFPHDELRTFMASGAEGTFCLKCRSKE